MKRSHAPPWQYASRPRTWARRNGIPISVICAVIFVAAYIVLFREPGWLYGPGLSKLTPAERVTAIDDVHGRMFQFATGLVAIVALAFTALNFWLSREGHMTDRFTKAIEQLGSASLDVRLGAIYSLERIMADSPRDHPTIVEVLAAYVREHARLTDRADRRAKHEAAGLPGSPATDTDVQAVLTVLGRRPAGREERGPLNLRSTDLTGANLIAADLAGADLFAADLTTANLSGANLASANMLNANLTTAILSDADLHSAMLQHATLHNVLMDGADLRDVDLNHTVLTDAFLNSADLRNAGLATADLTGTDLTNADLTGAHLGGANLTRAKLVNAKLIRAVLIDTNMDGADQTDADLTNAIYQHAPFPGFSGQV